MHPAYAVLLGLFLASVIARTIYEILRRKGRAEKRKTLNSVLILVLMCVLWISWFCMCTLDPWRAVVSDTVRWIGLALVGLGFALVIAALMRLQRPAHIRHLVTRGVLSFVRHPMPYGFILWILGWGLYHAARFSLGAGAVGIVNIVYWRHLEERTLKARYGDEYRRYRGRTWL